MTDQLQTAILSSVPYTQGPKVIAFLNTLT